ncbi:hypothetical protein [Microcella alkaliphila]|nr:hypothetical protein [Microcella alkaliphila]
MLVADPDESVRLAAARNGYTPGAAMLDALGMGEFNQTHNVGQGSVVSLCDLAADTTLGSKALHALAQSPFGQVRESVAKNSSTSAATLANLARDKSSQVREAVASHPATPMGVLTTLASDGVATVRGAVASNPATPTEALILLEREPDEEVALAVALHPNIPTSSLGALVEVPTKARLSTPGTRARSRLGPEGAWPIIYTPEQRKLIDQLDRSDNRWHQGVRQAVASHPPVSAEVLLRLSQQPDTVVFVARNPRTPSVVLSQLARHNDPLVRGALAAHSQTPETDLASLALDDSEGVRGIVAANLRTPTHSLEILASDFSPRVREVSQATLSLRGDSSAD